VDVLREWNPWWLTGEVPSKWLGKSREITEAVYRLLEIPEVKLLSGPRRAGKTTVMFQLINRLLAKEDWKNIVYVNLEDPLITRDVFNSLETFEYVFLDEVKPEDFPWIRRLYERGTNVVASSSTALTLKEGMKYLEGRAVLQKIYPLSFHEASQWKKPRLEEILIFGLFPRIFLENQDPIKRTLLSSYIETIGIKDVGGQEGYEFLNLLLQELPSMLSLQRLARTLRRRYENVVDVYSKALATDVVFEVRRFGYSGRTALAFPRKIYSIDNGLTSVAKRRPERGKLFENLVASELKKTGYNLYYFQGKRECDFVIEWENDRAVIQATLSPERDREQEGLEEAKAELNVPGLVLTPENVLGFLNVLPNRKSLFKWLKKMESKD
jgi:predicted AAA+ superfamily ATPase